MEAIDAEGFRVRSWLFEAMPLSQIFLGPLRQVTSGARARRV